METGIEFNRIQLLDGNWGEDRCWSEIPYGWAVLICTLHLGLKEISPNYRIEQVKEKFGTLRYYAQYAQFGDKTSIDTKAFDALIHEAEQKSASICMECGAPGTLKQDRWWRTTCDRCETQLWDERHNPDAYNNNRQTILAEIIPGLRKELEALGLTLPQ